MPSEYEMEYICSNCHKWFVWSFEFGTKAKQPKCPNCGVHPNDIKEMPYEYKHKGDEV